MMRPELGPPRELLRFEREDAQGAVVFRFAGEIDPSTVGLLWSNLKAACEDEHTGIVELSGVRSIDPTGLEALVDCHQIFVDRGQQLVLANVPERLKSLIKFVGPDRAIPIFPSVESALDSFRRRGKGSAAGVNV